ncbi:MAG TPA: ATP-binding cassette domain-containing protein [Candidatus Acidoferrum sp.]|nr:ATP-binding cassette domain-containing protein [Candidatus Acidoferrum sp.]
MKPIITAHHISKTFKSRGNRNLVTGLWRPEWNYKHAVSDISFEIMPGEAVAFLGPNGAGKTTTTKMMTGLIAPTEGNVTINGFTPFDRSPDFLRQIGLVMGNKAGLNWDLSARQSFWLLQNIYKIPQQRFDAHLKKLAELLDVTAHLDTQVRRLSLGERMKLELIGAIIHEPTILFLDEPTIGLDIIAKKNIRQFLRQIQKDDSITLVLTSHDMDDIEQVCDRVLVINHGTKIYDNSLAALNDHYKTMRYVRFVFDKQPAKAALEEFGELVTYDPSGVLLQIATETMIKTIATISSRFSLLDMRVESVPLEEIIEELFRTASKSSS